ncbi:LOW QUALITY PROTEIN: putative isomerase, partial [Streptomyces sp. C]
MSAPAALRFAYGTNGLADHRLGDALRLLADLGYEGVALTLDHQHLDPYAPGLAARLNGIRRALDDTGLDVVIETGARYLLDPRHKHRPTLLSADPAGRALRLDLLRRAVGIGAVLGAGAVHFWSGTPDPDTTREQAWRRLVDGCAETLGHAEAAGLDLAFEPEPGMLVADLAGYRRLLADSRPAGPLPPSPWTSATAAALEPLARRPLRGPGRRPPRPRPDRGHAPGHARAPPLRRRGDRLPARPARPRRRRLPGPRLRRTPAPQPRRSGVGPAQHRLPARRRRPAAAAADPTEGGRTGM